MTTLISKIKPKPYLHNCNRCGHEWSGNLQVPKTCANPKCRTPYWNKPRKREIKKSKPSIDQFFFYFENESKNHIYSFVIVDGEIICNECNNKTCNHVLEIMADTKIRQRITKQGIEFSSKYEMQIQELQKNVISLKEFVEN